MQLWKDMLNAAQNSIKSSEPLPVFATDGPGVIVAVCVRDHWNELDPEDKVWCVERLAIEIYADYENADSMVRASRSFSSPRCCAAYVISKLLTYDIDQELENIILDALANALTHPNRETVTQAAVGLGLHLSTSRQSLVLSSVSGLLWQANQLTSLEAEENKKQWADRRPILEFARAVAPVTSKHICSEPTDFSEELGRLDLTSWSARDSADIISIILSYCPESDDAFKFFALIAKKIAQIWDEHMSPRDHQHDRRDYEFENQGLQSLATFVMKLPPTRAIELCSPLLAACKNHPRDTGHFFQNLILEADRKVEREDSFWALWRAFAEQVKTCPWATHINSSYGHGDDLLSYIFLGIKWKKGIRSWFRLEGHSADIDALFQTMPPSSAVIAPYLWYLYQIGEQSLPHAFVLISEKLSASTTNLLADDNTVYFLESLLSRYVYTEPVRLKKEKAIREAVLMIMDMLVESGSSSAYRMRDDFLTPLMIAD